MTPKSAARSPIEGSGRARGRLLVMGATVLWGSSATLARFVFHRRQVAPLAVVELRLLIAAGLLGVWLALRNRGAFRVARRDWAYFLTLGVLGVASVQGSYYYSISKLGVGLAILLQYLAPVLILIYQALRGTPIRPQAAAAVVAAIAGTFLVVGNLGPSVASIRPFDWAVGFSSALTFAFYVVYSKRGLTRYPPETVLFYTFLIAGTCWAFVTPPWRIAAAHFPPDLWAMFLALGVFSTLIPFSLFYAGLRRLPALEAGIFATLEPVVALLASAVLLHEGLRLPQWLGAGLILVAAVISSLGD